MNCGIVLSFLMAFIPTQLSTTSHTETPEINATDVAPPTSAVTEANDTTLATASLNATNSGTFPLTKTSNSGNVGNEDSEESEGTLHMQMRLNDEFNSALLNPNTAEHQRLAQNITREVGNAFRKKYPESFLKSTINRFWNGSVGVDMTLTFRNQESVPSSTTAVQVIKDSLNARETSLDILPTSIIANTDRQNN
ncbi:uncharacterized protein [Centroberyx affinis]|uniref:uncharacterized protein isoform X2 n=1 Tax=Centroberyx affinis TaxID=166261 RepID=UPI003A5C771A